MTQQSSFSKLRNEKMHVFRDKMHKAESTEDVKKFYADMMLSIFNSVLGRDDPVRVEDVALNPAAEEGYVFSDSLQERPLFQTAWNESDLPYIVQDFTQMALNRYTHLQKNPEKTRSKIHHTDSKR